MIVAAYSKNSGWEIIVISVFFVLESQKERNLWEKNTLQAADSAQSLSLAQAVQRIPTRVREALVWAAVLFLVFNCWMDRSDRWHGGGLKVGFQRSWVVFGGAWKVFVNDKERQKE